MRTRRAFEERARPWRARPRRARSPARSAGASRDGCWRWRGDSSRPSPPAPTRLLGGVGVVEIHERLAVDALGQDRKIGPHLGDVERQPRLRAAGSGFMAPVIISASARRARGRSKSVDSSCSRSSGICRSLDHLAGERVEQHVARLDLGQAARTQVEHRLVVQLPDRRAVRALHVVGEDLELRVRVDGRVVRQQQRAVGLLGVGLLRVLADDDAAVEDALALAVEDALVELVARAVRHRVIDRGVVVHQAIAVDQVDAVHRAVGALALEADADVVAHQAAARGERVRREHAARRHVRLEVGDVERPSAIRAGR